MQYSSNRSAHLPHFTCRTHPRPHTRTHKPMGGHFGAQARVWIRRQAFWHSGARLGMRVGILAPGRAFGHVGGHFGAWARGRAFWRPGAGLGTRAGILASGRWFGHAGGHFDAWARVWARGRKYWRAGAHLATRAGILAPGQHGRAFWITLCTSWRPMFS